MVFRCWLQLGTHLAVWLAAGFNVGIITGGGSARFLSHWMENRMPHFDLPVVQADRFGNNMSTDAAIESMKACYQRGYNLTDAIT